MASAVDICNLALARLGDSATVASIDPPEGSAQSEHCARFYPLARRQIFEAHNWSFLIRREKLAPLHQESYGWPYVYAAPARLIHIVSIFTVHDKGYENTHQFLLERDARGQNVIYTDCPAAMIRYTRDTNDTGGFTPTFIEAFAYLLASQLAGPIISGTASIKIGAAMAQGYETALRAAISRDFVQQRKSDLNYMPAWYRWRQGAPDGTH